MWSEAPSWASQCCCKFCPVFFLPLSTMLRIIFINVKWLCVKETDEKFTNVVAGWGFKSIKGAVQKEKFGESAKTVCLLDKNVIFYGHKKLFACCILESVMTGWVRVFPLWVCCDRWSCCHIWCRNSTLHLQIHRRKVRVWQMLCILSPFITDDMVSKVTVMLDICLYVSNFQPSMYSGSHSFDLDSWVYRHPKSS
jgi:hypothetical protein